MRSGFAIKCTQLSHRQGCRAEELLLIQTPTGRLFTTARGTLNGSLTPRTSTPNVLRIVPPTFFVRRPLHWATIPKQGRDGLGLGAMGKIRGAVEGPRDNKSRRKGDRRTQSSSWRCSMEIQMVAVSLWLRGRGIGTWPPNMPSSAATGSLACAGTGATRVGKGAASDTDWAGDVPSSSSSA